MALNIKSSLKVAWQMPQPPIEPRSWRSVEPLSDCSSHEDIAIEQGCRLSPGCLSILRHAFKQGFTRFEGWEFDQITEAGIDAAKIYKRGVGWRDSSGESSRSITEGSYQIEIVEAPSDFGLLSTLDEYLCIIDQNVANLWPDLSKISNHVIVCCDETTKSLATVSRIIKETSSRDKPWLIIGGGVLTDIAGFAAYLCERSVSFAPTTLLSMVDACVGGKTGVNFAPYGKNQVGAFYFPERVLVWQGWLKTLSRRHLLAGASECFKHAFISGKQDLIDSLAQHFVDREGGLAELLKPLIQIKANIIRDDPAEQGKRAILNFGHTLAHALESLSHENTPNDYLLHGEAVALGMVYAAMLSQEVAGLSRSSCEQIITLLFDSGCVISRNETEQRLGRRLDAPELWSTIDERIRADKKTHQPKESRWILLSEIGKVAKADDSYTQSVSAETLHKVWLRFIERI